MISRKKVLVTDKISNKTKMLTQKYLLADVELIFCDAEIDCEEHIADADILITFTKGISGELLNKAKKCIYIQKYGAGVNNIAISEATKRGIAVGNMAGKNSRSVAEYAVMLMLAIYKRIITAHNKLINEGNWGKTVLRDNCYELSHKKVGLIGLGNIGRQVVQVLMGFECEIAYYDVSRLKPEDEIKLGVSFVDLEALIKESDVISLHAPLTKKTRHLINEEYLNAMKPNCILINTSRGGLIDEKALVKVLKSGHLLGVGLDVYESEPIGSEHPLAKIERVVLSPHNGGGTNEAIEAVVRGSCEIMNAILKYGKIINKNRIVNLEDLVKGSNLNLNIE